MLKLYRKLGLKDSDIQKNFAERYGIDMKEIFEDYYKADPNKATDGVTPEEKPKSETNEEDLLS